MSRTLDRSQGKFEAMPVSDGAPIVESGSNADGEWTRWADGTQICTRNTVEPGVDTNQITQSALDYPSVFVVSSQPSATVTAFQPGVLDPALDQFRVAPSDSGWHTVILKFDAVVASTVNITTTLMAIGRWK